jgi:hypothetical protein
MESNWYKLKLYFFLCPLCTEFITEPATIFAFLYVQILRGMGGYKCVFSPCSAEFLPGR